MTRLRRAYVAFFKALTTEPASPVVASTETWESPPRPQHGGYTTTLTVDYDERNVVKVTREAFSAILADAGYVRLT